jgi:hypothetical protein
VVDSSQTLPTDSWPATVLDGVLVTTLCHTSAVWYGKWVTFFVHMDFRVNNFDNLYILNVLMVQLFTRKYSFFNFQRTNVVVEWLALLLRFQEVSVSNFGPETGITILFMVLLSPSRLMPG